MALVGSAGVEVEAVRNEDIVIRRAEMADASAMAAFMDSLMAEKLDTISQQPAPTVEDEREFIARVQASDRAFILVAVRQGLVIGMLDLRVGEKACCRHVAQFGMSVSRTWRRHGVGRKLLHGAIREARAWTDVCRIELECVPWNTAAIRLYESMGFVIEARKRKAINLRGVPEDDLLMALVW